MLFVACGGDSASSSSGEDTRSVIDSLMDVYSITVEDDKLVMSFDDTVDKKKQVISFKEKVMPSWMCLVENEKFQWG
ncbi:MAG: hypothetical protein IJ912_02215, partial [Fibrobacter sp.]|nr:hypothetical protein [Fibrobacter sp.]